MNDFFDVADEPTVTKPNEPQMALKIVTTKRHVAVTPNDMINAIALISGVSPETLITRWILDGIRNFQENAK